MFTNVKNKIESYKTILPLTDAQLARFILICEIFLAVLDFVDETRATSESLTGFQDKVFTGKGGTSGELIASVPTFQTLTLPAGAFVDIFGEFQEMVDDIKRLSGYTPEIGADLMIVGEEGEDLVVDDLNATAKVEPKLNTGGTVRISGSMQGMKMMKLLFVPDDESLPQQSFFVSDLPAEIEVEFTGKSITGIIRVALCENNKPVGNWSPDYRVTIS